VEGNDRGKADNVSDEVEAGGCAEEVGGSAKDGNTSGSIDSCACAVKAAAKRTPATNGTAGREIFRLILPTASIVVRSEKAAKPNRMAARLEWR